MNYTISGSVRKEKKNYEICLTEGCAIVPPTSTPYLQMKLVLGSQCIMGEIAESGHLARTSQVYTRFPC